MVAMLIGVDSPLADQRFVLERLPVVVGRSADAGIRLEDGTVSRRHCRIDEEGGTLVVRDLGSTNGTLVNGVAVQHSPLRPGDRLTLGRLSFLANYPGQTVDAGSLVEFGALHVSSTREFND
jgi:pSer/pThr/pTyr-binding forkhead associated (FHA) protein